MYHWIMFLRKKQTEEKEEIRCLHLFVLMLSLEPHIIFFSDVGTETVYRQASVRWGAIIILAIVLMVIGAVIYSQSHVSTAEKAIADYMNDVTGVNVNSQTDDRAEHMIEKCG